MQGMVITAGNSWKQRQLCLRGQRADHDDAHDYRHESASFLWPHALSGSGPVLMAESPTLFRINCPAQEGGSSYMPVQPVAQKRLTLPLSRPCQPAEQDVRLS